MRESDHGSSPLRTTSRLDLIHALGARVIDRLRNAKAHMRSKKKVALSQKNNTEIIISSHVVSHSTSGVIGILMVSVIIEILRI